MERARLPVQVRVPFHCIFQLLFRLSNMNPPLSKLSPVKGDDNMVRDKTEEFVLSAVEMSTQSKQQLLKSSALLDSILTREKVARMDSETLSELAEYIGTLKKIDPIDAVLCEFPDGDRVPLGNHDIVVCVSKNITASFRRRGMLSRAAIHACLSCQEEPLPSNVLVVDHEAFLKGELVIVTTPANM
jgi:hypothetical protein